MKKYNIIFIASFLMLAACNKKLDTVPTGSLDAADALKTSSDVQIALVGSYADLGANDFYSGRIFVETDLLGDFNEINWSGTYQGMTQIRNKSIPVDNLFVTNAWLAGYKANNDVNNVLNALSVVTPAQKNRIEGEAKFIRGCIYFDLVRMFAKAWNDGNPANNPGVPIVLKPTTLPLDATGPSRSTVSEVYAQVISDLTDAEAKLPTVNGIFFATKNSASAMLARVYLQKGDYANAAAEANKVITSGKYALTPTYPDAFPFSDPPAQIQNTVEDVFAMQVNATQGFNGFNEFYSTTSRGDIDIRSNHLALYEPGDDRLNLFYSSGGSVYTGKHDNVYGNVHIIRLAEMYLIRAEANFRLNTSVGARVNLAPLATVTLAQILKERKLELAFEGFTLHDVKRLQGTVGALPWNSPKLIYPIPQREIRVNTNLTQNEGY
jgi:starch-binding outer membrane protein, SusD/RagB family